MTLLPHEEEILARFDEKFPIEKWTVSQNTLRHDIKNLLLQTIRERDRYVKKTIEGMKKTKGNGEYSKDRLHPLNVYNQALDDILTYLREPDACPVHKTHDPQDVCCCGKEKKPDASQGCPCGCHERGAESCRKCRLRHSQGDNGTRV